MVLGSKVIHAIKPAELRIRPATLADAEGVCRVQQRNGVGGASESSWRGTWEAYPFEQEFQDVPIGWVLELGDGSIVGCLDNVHMLYEWKERRIRAAIAAGWAVDAEYRGKSLQLMTTFFRQKGIDLLLNVSANRTTAEVLTAMKVARIPVPDFGIPCFWAVRPRAFAKAVLLKKGIRGASGLAWPTGLLLLVGDILRRSGRGHISLPVHRVRNFDDRFDRLWEGIRTGPARLRAVRTCAALKWRFRNELKDDRIAIVVAEPGGTLAGYAVLVRREGSELGMQLYDIADLQSLHDNPEVIRNLLLGSIGVARQDRIDAVKFMPGTPSKRSAANALKPYCYTLPFWQQYYRASPDLTTTISAADVWDFSLFDMS
jgi:hypothetical protein